MKQKKITLVGIMIMVFILISLQLTALPFRKGERIRFEIRVWGIHVGYQNMYFKGVRFLNGKKVLYAVADTKSIPVFGVKYKLHDVMHVWMDPVTLLPVKIYKDIHEGSWKNKVTILINQKKRRAVYYDKRNKKGAVIKLHNNTLDILSMIYYIRSMKTIKNGRITFDYLVDKKKGREIATLHVKRGRIKVGRSLIKTLIFQQLGGKHIKVVMTDDKYKIPLKITVGAFKVHGYRIDIVGNLIGIKK